MTATAKKKIKISKATPGIGDSNDDWKVRSDFRTLCEAKEIEADKGRMEKVRAYAKTQMMECAAIAADDDTN